MNKPAHNRIPMVGKIFGYLTVISHSHTVPKQYAMWNCKCICGKAVKCRAQYLRNGITKSCGCKHIIPDGHPTHFESKNQFNGLKGTKEWRTWVGIKNRCTSPKSTSYRRYGGRGIKIFPEWEHSYEAFRDYIVGHVGRAPTAKHQIERKNNDGNYEPGNLTWATSKEQSYNKSNNKYYTVNGKTLHLVEWAKSLNLTAWGLRRRIKNAKYPIETLLTTTKRQLHKNHLGFKS